MNKPEKPAAGGTLRLAAKPAAKKTLLADGTRRPSVRPKGPARARPQSEVLAEREQRAQREQRMERQERAAPGGAPARPSTRPTAPGADRFAQGDRLPRRHFKIQFKDALRRSGIVKGHFLESNAPFDDFEFGLLRFLRWRGGTIEEVKEAFDGRHLAKDANGEAR